MSLRTARVTSIGWGCRSIRATNYTLPTRLEAEGGCQHPGPHFDQLRHRASVASLQVGGRKSEAFVLSPCARGDQWVASCFRLVKPTRSVPHVPSEDIVTVTTTAMSLLLLPAVDVAFNPQPDPPGKLRAVQTSLGGPDTKTGNGGKRGTVMITEENGKVMRQRRNR